MSELNNCPCCPNGKGELVEMLNNYDNGPAHYYRIKCTECGLMTESNIPYITMEWNTRQPCEKCEQLKNEIQELQVASMDCNTSVAYEDGYQEGLKSRQPDPGIKAVYEYIKRECENKHNYPHNFADEQWQAITNYLEGNR